MKTTLQYLKEIGSTTKTSFAMPLPPKDSIHERGTYRTGDGDYVQPVRPGSLDHKKWKSRGLLASTSS